MSPASATQPHHMHAPSLLIMHAGTASQLMHSAGMTVRGDPALRGSSSAAAPLTAAGLRWQRAAAQLPAAWRRGRACLCAVPATPPQSEQAPAAARALTHTVTELQGLVTTTYALAPGGAGTVRKVGGCGICALGVE